MKVYKHILKRKEAGTWDDKGWAWADEPTKWEGKAWHKRPWANQQWKDLDHPKSCSWNSMAKTKHKAEQAEQISTHRDWSYTYPGGKWNGTLPQLPAANKIVLAQVNVVWNEAEVIQAVTTAVGPPRFMLPAKSSSPHHQAWVVGFAQPEEAAGMIQSTSLPADWLVIPYRPKGGQPVSAAAGAVEAEAMETEAVEHEEFVVVDESDAEVVTGPLQAGLADLELTWPLPAAQPGQQVTFLAMGLHQLPPAAAAQLDWGARTTRLICDQVGMLLPEYKPSQGLWTCVVDCRPPGDPSLMPIRSAVHTGFHTTAVMNVLADSNTCTQVLLQLQKAWQKIEWADHKVVALVDRSSGHEALSWARILAAVCRQLGYQAYMDSSLVHRSFQQCLRTCAPAETASPLFLDEVIQAVRTCSALLPTYGLASRLKQ